MCSTLVLVLFFTGLDNSKEILRDAMLDQAVWKEFVRMAWDDSLPNVSFLCR